MAMSTRHSRVERSILPIMPKSKKQMVCGATISRFHQAKMVAEVGMMPITLSVKWPGVATVSGIDPDSPPCQITKPE